MSAIKFNSVSEGIALRLNQIAGNLAPLGLAFDPNTGNLRVGPVNVASVQTFGGFVATTIVIDTMNNAWAASVRARIT